MAGPDGGLSGYPFREGLLLLLRILEECRSYTNKRCCMGHLSLEDLEERLREVRQKN